MSKKFYSLGLMSGTSMDGIHASINQSDGKTNYKVILDRYISYSKSLYIDLVNLRDKITVKKAMFVNTYINIYITTPLIPAILEEAKPINT